MRNMNVKIFMLMVLIFSGWAGARDRITPQAAEAIVEKAWKIVDAEYPMFGIRENLDWDALGRQYLVQAKKARTYHEVGNVVARMLSHLRDGHVWVKHNGKHLHVFKVPHTLNVNRNIKIYGR